MPQTKSRTAFLEDASEDAAEAIDQNVFDGLNYGYMATLTIFGILNMLLATAIIYCEQGYER